MTSITVHPSFTLDDGPEIVVNGGRGGPVHRGGGGGSSGRGSGGGRSSTGRGSGGGGGVKALGSEAREAAAALRELDSDLSNVRREFDPAAAAAEKYAEALAKITALEKAGKISLGEGANYRNAALERQTAELESVANKAADSLKGAEWNSESGIASVVKGIKDAGIPIADAGKKAGDAFYDRGTEAATAISQIIGGKLGGTLEKIIGVIQGVENGNFQGLGGRVGGILTLVSGGGKAGDGAAPDGAANASPFITGMREVFAGFKSELSKLFTSIFGQNGILSAEMQKALGAAFANAQVGGAIGKGVTDVLGIKGSKLGAQIGGAIGGAVAGPLGAAVGGVLGSVVGGLFKKSKTGSASLSYDGSGYVSGAVGGNNSALQGQSRSLANSVGASLTSIADQLGGIVSGAARGSIGYDKKGRVVVDPTGQNRTKGAGVRNFGKDGEDAARAFLLADAISDGAITGISEKVRQALSSSTDIDRALREAMKVDEIENILAGFGGAARKAFVDFERQAKERLRIAGKYGFDLVKLEAQNAKDRNKLFESTVEQAVGSLKTLLEDLTTGERAAGTVLERKAALQAKADALVPLAATDSDAASKLAGLLDQIERLSLEAYGTAGAQYAADRNSVRTTAEAIIAQATADIQHAQDTARTNAGTDSASTDALISQSNTLLNEANNQNAQIISLLGRFGGSGSVGASNFYQALSVGSNIL